MKVAIIANERALRERLEQTLSSNHAASMDSFATASHGLTPLTTTPYDLVLMHWKVHPGVSSGHEQIDNLAGLIPDCELNRNLLYWEVCLAVIDAIREPDGPNMNTPVMILLPNLGMSGFQTGDQLTREAVETDVRARGHVHTLFSVRAEDISQAISRL